MSAAKPAGESTAPAPEAGAPALPTPIAVAAVVVFCLVGGLSAIIEVLLIPFYVGPNVFPVTVVIAVFGNFALPRLVRITVDWPWAIGLPLLSWIVVAVLLGFWNTSRSVLVPGSGQDGYVALAFYFLGALVGFVSVLRETSPARAGSSARP